MTPEHIARLTRAGAWIDRPLHHAFDEFAERTPDVLAVADQHERLTYAELRERSINLAAWLLEQELSPGASVGLQCGNRVALAITHLACDPVATLQADGRARTQLVLQEPGSEVDAALPQLGVGEPFVLVGDGQHVWSARRGLVEGVVERTFDPCTCAAEAGDVFRSQRLDRHGVTFCRRSG